MSIADDSSGVFEVSDSFFLIRNVFVSSRRNETARVAVVLHVYYRDLFDEVFEYISNIPEPYDLYVTTPFESDLSHILDVSERRKQAVTVVLTRNNGRDVGPFLAVFRTGCLDRYDSVLKLHTKKSGYSDKGEFWRRELYALLCGSPSVVKSSLALLREKGCGIIGPARYFLTHPSFWGGNRARLSIILQDCHGGAYSEELSLGFFAGTMFWFAPAALAAIHACNGESVAFEPESGTQDGTLAHAWERAFCLISRAKGYCVSAVELDGRDMFSADNMGNHVPVLHR